MSKTLVLVLTHPGARDILERNWPHILKCACDVGVVFHVGQISDYDQGLPSCKLRLSIGTDPDKMPHRWVSRLMEVLEYCVKLDDYRNFCLVESDVIFSRSLPDHPGGMVATLAGGKSDGFHGSKFYHCPWWVSYKTAEKILRWGKLMLAAGLDEHGFIDRFIGLMADLYPLQITEAKWYSQNTILPQNYSDARKYLDLGGWGAHGVKDQQTLEALTL